MSATAAGSDRRAEIIATGARLFAERGIAHTSIRDIGDAAGILGGSLYDHFRSKDDLVDLIHRGSTSALDQLYRDALSGTDNAAEQFVAMVHASFEMFDRYPEATVIYMNDRQYLAARPRFDYLRTAEERHHKLWRSVVVRGVRSGVFRPDLDAELTSRLVQDAVWITGRRWVRTSRARRSIDELAGATSKILLGGLTG